MNTASSNQAPTDAIPNVNALLQSLRLKGNLAAIWKAGDWIDTHLGGKPADRGDFKRVLEAVQKKAEKDVPVSMNHLQKCRQFRLNWEPDDVDRAVEVELPWRRAIQLTVIKHHAKILAETSPKRAAQIRLKCDTLVKSFPGSNKKVMPAWAEEVEKLKQECQNENPGAQKYHKRLLVDYWQAAVFRLNEVGKQIDKMSKLLSDGKLKRRAGAAKKYVDAAIRNMKKIYTPKENKPRKST